MCPENDNFTYIRTLGRSVVDCICTFHDHLSNCKFFKEHLTGQLLDSWNVFKRVIPDHSILELVFIPHFIVPNTNDRINVADHSTNNNSSRDKRINIEKLYTENPQEFWSALKKLGHRKIIIFLCKYMMVRTGEIDKVMAKWKFNFNNLFQGYDTKIERLEAEGNNENTEIFNSVLSLEEIQKVINRAKHNKSVGIDNLPNEIFKNKMSSQLLLSLFCFSHYPIFLEKGNN